MIKTNSIAVHEEVKVEENPLNRRFDRFTEAGLTTQAAAFQLNNLRNALQGITTITTILIANGVAEDCEEPALKGHLSGGLIVAANALAEYAESDLCDFADWAERRAEAEACHG